MRSHQNRHRRGISRDSEGLIGGDAAVASAVGGNRHHLVAAHCRRGVAKAVRRRGCGIHQHSVHVERHRTDRRSASRRRARRKQRAASLHHRAGHRRRQRHYRRCRDGGGDVQGHDGRLGLVAIRVGGDRGDGVAAHALGAERRAGERRVQHPLVGRALARSRSNRHSIRIEINSRHQQVVAGVGRQVDLRAQRGARAGLVLAACGRVGHLHHRRAAGGGVHRHVDGGRLGHLTHVVGRLHRQFVSTGPGQGRGPGRRVGRAVAHPRARRHQSAVGVEAHAGDRAVGIAGGGLKRKARAHRQARGRGRRDQVYAGLARLLDRHRHCSGHRGRALRVGDHQDQVIAAGHRRRPRASKGRARVGIHQNSVGVERHRGDCSVHVAGERLHRHLLSQGLLAACGREH